jgi:Na+-translocating ferredoxin:NAD+ oxidoreductase RnfD subunit
MDRNKNFQGMTNVNKYLEAALLPRFLAPNKIQSGDKEIFNEFSGHTINENTSMGLGIFADGYVAYGATGVYIFAFALGLIFSLTFKLVERWTKVSPFYVLLLLPLLNYAVRPDCELQTTINHLFKGILLFGFLVYLTRKRFSMDSAENQRKLSHLNLMK